MPLGILEPQGEPQVPGSIILDESAAQVVPDSVHLKHGTGKDAHIILSPQPSDDPNDPLNWSTFQKGVTMSVIAMGTMINGALPGPILNAAFVQISIELNVSVIQIAKLTGYLLLVTGATGLFFSALSTKYGKRPLYLFSSLMGVVACIVGETASGYHLLLTARVLQGFAVTAYESLAIASIGDLYFVHERGPPVGGIVMMLTAIGNAVSIIAGPISATLGWRYNFHILLPFVILQFLGVVFFCPETAYRRSHDPQAHHEKPGPKDTVKKERTVEAVERIETISATQTPVKKTFFQKMAVYNGTFSDHSIFKMVIACPVILTNVGASYSIFVSGTVIAWFVAVAMLSSLLFTAPPYLYNAAGVGYTSVGPLVGGVLASLITWTTFDPCIRWLVRKNHGVYEPEFRLLLIIPGVITTVAGLSGFGHAVELGKSIYLVCFLWGVILFGMTIVAGATMAYALDAFRMDSTEIFVMSMVHKNFFYYGVTEFVITWYLKAGAAEIFDVMAGVSAGLCLLTIPMYIWGKKYRYFWSKHDVITALHLRTHGGEELQLKVAA